MAKQECESVVSPATYEPNIQKTVQMVNIIVLIEYRPIYGAGQKLKGRRYLSKNNNLR